MDRISLLPDRLLHKIVSFVDPKSAVQTCVLSKRWRHVWTGTQTLNFSFDSQQSSPQQFIKKLLLEPLRFKSIQNLSFFSSIHSQETLVITDLLLRFARRHSVQQIHLNTFNTLCTHSSVDFSIPLCGLLVKSRTLCNQVLFSPSLKFLKVEFFDVVLIDSCVGESYFSSCCNLESLVLVNFFCHRLRISLPKLEKLELFSCSSRWDLKFPQLHLFTCSIKSVKFINILPTIVSASKFTCIDAVNIAVDDSDFDGEDDSAVQKLKASICELLKVFRNAKSVTLPLKAMKMILSDPSSLSNVSFHNLRFLKFKTEGTDQMTSLSIGTLKNSLNCPNLEKLQVDIN